MSIEKLLKNDNVPELGMGKIQPFLDIVKPQNLKKILTKKIYKKCKSNDYKDYEDYKDYHAYKSYASNYKVDILKFFNPELQLKNNKSGIKNKLKSFLFNLKRFTFLKILVS